MGLKDVVSEENQKHKYRYYPDHELQDEIEKVVEETVEELPGDVEVDFIEVSPRMTGNILGRHIPKDGGDTHLIRLKENLVENRPWEYVERVIKHEVVHVWFAQNGYGDYGDGSRIFEWVLGRVGADISGISFYGEEYDIIHEFDDPYYVEIDELREED